ncbi:MAG: alpha/beta fold hydrolase, partial [Bacteroidia bacterium]
MEKLLLLHGALGSKEQFKELSLLLGEKYEIHSLDFYGHGQVGFAEEFSIASFARQVSLYLLENSIQSINIFGYSMGGYVGLYLARHYPGVVRKVMTLATKFSWSPEEAQNEAGILNADLLESKSPSFVLEQKERHGEYKWKQLLNETAAMMIGLGAKNALTKKDLSEINSPVLIGAGDRDKMVGLEESI